MVEVVVVLIVVVVLLAVVVFAVVVNVLIVVVFFDAVGLLVGLFVAAVHFNGTFVVVLINSAFWEMS